MKKFTIRDLIFVVLVFLVLFSATSALQMMDREDDPSYAQIRQLFEQEKVRYFEVRDDNTLVLELRDPEETVSYRLASFQVFYDDLHELIDQQWTARIIEDYDYPPGFVAPWWLS